MKIFTVKSLYKIRAKGKVKAPHKSYEKDTFLVEERIVLFKARNEKEALKKAKKEIEEYCSYKYFNHFGQEVITENLGVLDIFELFDDEIGNGVEVFSATDVVREKISKRDLLKQRVGDEDRLSGRSQDRLRAKFINREFSLSIESYLKSKKS
ncbi:MAG: DUF4288 domain-containing protein [Halobacteriovoraceae bacterium]|nr:DUF4288 domain-containing protein [Halobacteriovoraceae bacterium]